MTTRPIAAGNAWSACSKEHASQGQVGDDLAWFTSQSTGAMRRAARAARPATPTLPAMTFPSSPPLNTTMSYLSALALGWDPTTGVRQTADGTVWYGFGSDGPTWTPTPNP